MIKNNNNSISSIYDKETVIGKIIKGTLLVWEAFKKLIASEIPPLTLLKCKGVDLVDYKIYGNSIQDGTPTPDTPIEFVSVGDRTPNLCEEMKFHSNELATVEAYKDGFKATAKQGATGYNNYVKSGVMLHLNKLEWGKTYTLSCYVEQSNSNMSSLLRIGYVDATNNSWQDFKRVVAINNSINTITFTLPDEQPAKMGSDKGSMGVDGVQFFVNVQRAEIDTLETITVTNIMLVEGETPAEYEPVGYKIPVKVRGKNLFNKNEYTYTLGYYNDNGDFQPTSNGDTAYTNNYSKVEPNTTYHISELHGYNGLTLAVYFYDNNNQWISRYKYYGNGKTSYEQGTTFTTPNKCKYVRFQIYIGTKAQDKPFNADTFQFELGDKFTGYEPYTEITTNIYLKEPLRKTKHKEYNSDIIYEFTDYIDFEKGRVIRNNKEFVLDGSYSIQLANWRYAEGYYAVGYAHSTFPDLAKKELSVLCNKLPTKNYGALYSQTNPVEGISLSNSSVYSMFIRLKTDTITTKEQYYAYLNENPLTIVAGLNTPDDTETIELPNIPTHEGTNIIEIDTSISPSNMEVEYYAKGVS